MIPAVGILEMGPGPNLVSSKLIPPKWTEKIKPIAYPGVMAATKQKVTSKE